MKIIHVSDLHFDSKIEGLIAEKSKIRKDEILRTFERLIKYARDNCVKAVIIAGDMFDTEKISEKTKGRVLACINSVPEIDFLYLSGNHEENGFIRSLTAIPENLKIFGDEWTKYKFGNIVISGIVNNGKNERSMYDTLSLDENDVNIVVMHGQIAGYKNTDSAEIISLPLLRDKNIDYLALGHIHSYNKGKLDDRGVYCYSGCLEGRGFDETGEKGFVMLDVTEKKVVSEFYPFALRSLYEFTFDVEGEENWYVLRDKIVGELLEKCSNGSLIKVILTGEHGADFDVDREGLSFLLNEKFFFAKVYDRTTLTVNRSDYENDKSLRGEFVRTVLESDIDEEKKKSVIMMGLKALKGEDVL